MFPDDYKYTKSHEWCRLEGAEVVIGITQFAADALTDITYVSPLSVGDNVKKGGSLGEVESVKSTSDIYSPFEGKIVLVNDALVDDPGIINSDPHKEGWIVRLAIDDVSEFEKLMTAEEYKTMLEEHH